MVGALAILENVSSHGIALLGAEWYVAGVVALSRTYPNSFVPVDLALRYARIVYPASFPLDCERLSVLEYATVEARW